MESRSAVEQSVQVLKVKLLQETRLAPTQTRIVPLLISQEGPYSGDEISVSIWATSFSGQQTFLSFSVPVKQLTLWDADHYSPVTATYFYGTSTPTAFIAIPPKLPNEARWPSAYADGGQVGWSKVQSDNGRLAVSFPKIRLVIVLELALGFVC